MRKKSVTQNDIAKALNLSRITVSKALTGKEYVSETTKEAVLDMARKLGYSGLNNAVCKYDSLNPYLITLLLPKESFANPYWNELISSISDYFQKHNVRLIFSLISDEDQRNGILPQSLSNPKPDGIIVLGFISDSYFQLLLKANIPLVSYDLPLSCHKPNRNIDIITLEDEIAVDEITSKLISLGHRSIAFFGYKEACLSFYDRYLGYVHAMLRQGIQPIDALANNPSFTPNYSKDYHHLLSIIQNMTTPPTAIVCANDKLADTCIRMKESTAPKYNNLVVTGFDNTDYLRINDKLFATVEPFLYNAGIVLAERILLRIKNPNMYFTNTKLCCQPIYHNNGVVL